MFRYSLRRLGFVTTIPVRRSIVPMFLGIAMLGVVVAAAMTPDTGAVPAVASSQYNAPPPPQLFLGLSPIEGYGLLALILALAVLFGAIALRRRRRGGETQEEEAPPESEPPEPPAPEEPPAGASEVYDEGAEPAPAPAEGEEPSPEIDDLMRELDRISKELNGGPGPPPEP